MCVVEGGEMTNLSRPSVCPIMPLLPASWLCWCQRLEVCQWNVRGTFLVVINLRLYCPLRRQKGTGHPETLSSTLTELRPPCDIHPTTTCIYSVHADIKTNFCTTAYKIMILANWMLQEIEIEARANTCYTGTVPTTVTAQHMKKSQWLKSFDQTHSGIMP